MELGICYNCNKKQTTVTEGGYWTVNFSNKIIWYCSQCHGNKNHLLAVCEWCGSSQIERHQGKTYDCPQCKSLERGKYKQ